MDTLMGISVLVCVLTLCVLSLCVLSLCAAIMPMQCYLAQTGLAAYHHMGQSTKTCKQTLNLLVFVYAGSQAGLGKYCVHLLADYITTAAAPPLDTQAGAFQAMATVRQQDSEHWEALTGLPAAALREGALALYGACSPAEVK